MVDCPSVAAIVITTMFRGLERKLVPKTTQTDFNRWRSLNMSAGGAELQCLGLIVIDLLVQRYLNVDFR